MDLNLDASLESHEGKRVLDPGLVMVWTRSAHWPLCMHESGRKGSKGPLTGETYVTDVLISFRFYPSRDDYVLIGRDMVGRTGWATRMRREGALLNLAAQFAYDQHVCPLPFCALRFPTRSLPLPTPHPFPHPHPTSSPSYGTIHLWEVGSTSHQLDWGWEPSSTAGEDGSRGWQERQQDGCGLRT